MLCGDIERNTRPI